MNDDVSHARALVKAAFAGHTNKGGFDYYTHHLERVEREAQVYGLPQGYDSAKNMQILGFDSRCSATARLRNRRKVLTPV